ncbi:MAG: NAD(P)H:quinone oxidoreductase [Desulfonatronovibrionaceae bacterium]
MLVKIVYYSMYGHVHAMAQAVAEGVARVSGTQAQLRQVPETLSSEVLDKMGALKARENMSSVKECTVDELPEASAIIFGTPTRFGNMCGQMRQFLDATGRLWAQGALVGKAGSVFVSTATQHGGQESTILSFHLTLLHHGMVIVGLPYSFQGQTIIEEMSGCSPYGASTIAGGQGQRMPSRNELDGALFQGQHVAEIASRLG